MQHNPTMMKTTEPHTIPTMMKPTEHRKIGIRTTPDHDEATEPPHCKIGNVNPLTIPHQGLALALGAPCLQGSVGEESQGQSEGLVPGGRLPHMSGTKAQEEEEPKEGMREMKECARA